MRSYWDTQPHPESAESSNFIEGTEFTLEGAESIVFDGQFPHERAAVGHDLLGTYRLVADPQEMSRIPATADELVYQLQYRNSIIMSGRPENRPGEFKLSANRAGQTQFVDPDLVDGTLREGFLTALAFSVLSMVAVMVLI